MATSLELSAHVEQRLLARNQVLESFFAREARRLAEACQEMSDRFLHGGRLLAFGRGPMRRTRSTSRWSLFIRSSWENARSPHWTFRWPLSRGSKLLSKPKTSLWALGRPRGTFWFGQRSTRPTRSER